MGSAIHRGLAALITAGACTACEGSVAATGDARLRHHESLADVHEYGVTSCPHELGTLEVQLPASAPAAVTLSVTETMPWIDVLDPELGWPILDGYTIPIAPGQRLVFELEFNCGTTDDVSGLIRLATSSRNGGPTLESASIPITLDVQGAP